LTGFLVDTSIISVFAPGRPPLPENFRKWITEQRNVGSWYVSPITIAEIERGVSKLRRSGASAKAQRLNDWLEGLLSEFGNRLLFVDAEVAREAGRLDDAATSRGRNPGLADVFLAATARVHGLSLLTANGRHFAVLEVAHFNPLASDFRPT
jgi:toxin FitB